MNKEGEKRLDNKQYMQILNSCHGLFSKKLQDYGPAWRILRPSSVTDQIYIKVARIRSLQLTGENLVGESIESEFIGIVNYGIVGIIQFVKGFAEKVDITVEEAERLYNIGAEDCIKIMEKKNHDYGEAWRNMRVETITDLILSKVFRTKQIEDNNGNTIASEGIGANYIDMVNYAIFALCLLNSSIETAGTAQECVDFHEGNGRLYIKSNGELRPADTLNFKSGHIPTDLIDVEKAIFHRNGSIRHEGLKVDYGDSSMEVDMTNSRVSIRGSLPPMGDKIQVAVPKKPEITPGTGTEQ